MRATTLRAALPRLTCVAMGTLALSTTLPVHAQPPRKPQAAARPTLSLEEIAIMVAASDENEVRSALEAAALLPAVDVLPIVEERIRNGLPHELLDVAIDSLLLLNDRAAGPLLAELARHRRAAVRTRCLDALAHLKASEAERVLVDALGDGAPEVRAAAAGGLGELGSAQSVTALRKALQRDVEGAARALGLVARPEQLDQLLDIVGTTPLASLTPMFSALFARRDLPEREKLRVVDKLARVASDESRAMSAKLLAEVPSNTPAAVRTALARAAKTSTPP